MLQTILIGPPRGDLKGGIAQFIQFVLHYDSLALRLFTVAAVWGIGWLVWPFLANLGFFAFEIYASLIVIRVLTDVSQRGQLGRIIAAMWLPIGVTAVATYLLFVNDQGRELGIGLMDSYANGPFLFLVLIYWGLNNWLSARVGLARAFPEPEKEQVLLFWGPRLVGVTAHLLVAFSLSAAALSQRDLEGKMAPWLVFAAPLAILLATAFAWLLDYGYLSQRSNDVLRPLARKWMHVVGGLELLLLVGLLFAWRTGEVPPGFFWGTVFVAASAVAFLGLISWLRRKAPRGKAASYEDRKIEDRSEENITRRWTLSLALCMLIGTAAIWIWPMQVGQFFGSLIIASFAFGSFLALTNLFDLMATRLTHYGGRIGFAFGARAIAAVFLCFLVLPTILTSLTQSFHRVRLCEEKGCTPAPASKGKNWSVVQIPAERPTVSDAARAWYKQAEPAYHSIYPGRPVPMLLVATAGGGIRAAYWTATILERLEHDLRKEAFAQSSQDKVPPDGLLRNLLFAISGVSGGSVGAAAYAGAVHDHEVNGADIEPTKYLREDFLAPGLASMIFIDGPANVLPDFGQIDRGQALELGFEYASRTERDKDGLVSHKFLSFFPANDAAAKSDSWRPALLFNATHQETGRRIITSHVKIERDVFLDSYDALQVLGSDMRLSTAAHNSARFTYVSPAGNLFSTTKHNRGYIIDGGYFENYGAQTTLELARKAIDAIDPNHENKVKLVVLQISSDPSLKKDRTLVRVRRDEGACVVSSSDPATSIRHDADGSQSGSKDQANYLNLIDPANRKKNEGEGFVLSSYNELSAPLLGIMSVREAHGTVAAAELAGSICQGKGKVQAALENAMERKTVLNVTDSTGTLANIGSDAPHFSHLAMSEPSWIDRGVAVNPPLGWVLSNRTRSRFADILKDCGNENELAALEAALGLPASASSGTTTSDAKNIPP
jgi:hypothetical protein